MKLIWICNQGNQLKDDKGPRLRSVGSFCSKRRRCNTKENFELLFSPLVRHSSALPQASGQAAQTALALEYMNVDMMTMVAPSANAAFGSNPCDVRPRTLKTS